MLSSGLIARKLLRGGPPDGAQGSLHGIGQGVAIPHAKVPMAQELLATFGGTGA
jgi:hypothetical protein